MWKILLIIVCSIWSQVSLAGQSCEGLAGGVVTFSPGTIYESPDMPVGSTLYTSVSPSVMILKRCNGDPTAKPQMVYATGTKSSYGQNVYETGIQGVGVRVKIWGSYAVNPPPLPIWTLYENDNVMSGPITLELIKTGPVSGGIMPNGVLIRENLGSDYISPLSPSITNTIVQSSTCSVSTKNIQVKLDDVIAAEMENVGSTYNPKDFTVGLNCDLGARVSATLTGTKNTDTNADGVLKISNAGSNGVADGVGIQILYNNVPMPLNKLISLKTFTNEIENIPFTAQYYQTKSTVTMGSVNATATLDITYQ